MRLSHWSRLQRTARQQLADEVVALRANAEETARVAEELINGNWTAHDGPRSTAFELEAVQAQAEELRFKLEEANGLYAAMVETLRGMGIPAGSLTTFDLSDDQTDSQLS